VGAALTIKMQSIPGAGYVWEIDEPSPDLEVVENKVVAQSEEVGGPSTQRFTLLPHRPGEYSLVFGLKRKWEKDPARTKKFNIHVTA